MNAVERALLLREVVILRGMGARQAEITAVTGLPQQTVSRWLADLRALAKQRGPHEAWRSVVFGSDR